VSAERIVVTRAGGFDENRDPLPTTEAPFEAEIYYAEPIDGGETKVGGASGRNKQWRLYLVNRRGEPPILSTDTVLFRGLAYQVNKPPLESLDPDGDVEMDSLQVELYRGEGA
jgi:hypothetical protein